MAKKATIKFEDMVDIKGITKNQTEVLKEYKKGKLKKYFGKIKNKLQDSFDRDTYFDNDTF